MTVQEIKDHLTGTIIPFWRGMRDNEYGGYYGLLSYDLRLNRKAVKGCILNSRILWFFSNAYGLLGEEALLKEADHAYAFMDKYCLDKQNGGVYWSVDYDGNVEEGMKHTYNQAFAIYALASYYRVSKKEQVLKKAKALFELIESKCCDSKGYLEAFTEDFQPIDNEKLSENGVMAEKTMNTLLHVFEAYTELYDVTKDERVGAKLRWIMDIFAEKVYNPKLRRQEVFFDADWNSLIDLHSFGHDIESAWLIDRGCDVLQDGAYTEKMRAVTQKLEACVYEKAFNGHSLANEAENGVIDPTRVWWVQAETVVGFYNAWQKAPEQRKYLEAAEAQWQFINEYVVDKREGSEWFGYLNEDGSPVEGREIVEPWKCPYHNGRMCIELIRRMSAQN